MKLLIATDEAGYGPRLGPLVIVATAWQLDPNWDWEGAEAKLAEPIELRGLGYARVDDSKRLFRRRIRAETGRNPPPGTKVNSPNLLDRLTTAAARWIDWPEPDHDELCWLQRLAPRDWEGLVKQPWFADLAQPAPCALTADGSAETEPALRADDDPLVRHWRAGGLQLVDIAARILDVARYNEDLNRFGNKAELLSGLTCELAVQTLQRQLARDLSASEVRIFSDRHGGRARYGGLLQHHCPDHLLNILSEGKPASTYRLQRSGSGDANTPTIDWSFTIGGDRYPPVAMASIIAKATRERLMDHFNAYFGRLWQTAQKSPARAGIPAKQLRPTAGYASDAERFLNETHDLRRVYAIRDECLIRNK